MLCSMNRSDDRMLKKEQTTAHDSKLEEYCAQDICRMYELSDEFRHVAQKCDITASSYHPCCCADQEIKRRRTSCLPIATDRTGVVPVVGSQLYRVLRRTVTALLSPTAKLLQYLQQLESNDRIYELISMTSSSSVRICRLQAEIANCVAIMRVADPAHATKPLARTERRV